ncbi:unnamed protein product [Arabis nemorensis]|uniref:Bifunctional inhibitor/plant lipid transfer protein/seed storage helical domain-containing protein n=1 Tax=Arabis nemorensis TaxID=586526 RepID=A0A565CRG7_9BRAS|nr:unnamed protein product [Arabis nemorensis]
MEKQIFCQFLVVMVLLSSSHIQGNPGCNDFGIEVLYKCSNSMDKKLPAPPKPFEDCCTAVRTIGMKCVCEVINKEIETVIDMQKFVKVVDDCGRPLAAGSQCGSYRVPGINADMQ